MKKCKKNESYGALKLALIITGSIVAAAGIILLIVKLCKKKKCHCCECAHDDDIDVDSWNIDEEFLSNLEIDDDFDEIEADSDETTAEPVAEAAAPEEAEAAPTEEN